MLMPRYTGIGFVKRNQRTDLVFYKSAILHDALILQNSPNRLRLRHDMLDVVSKRKQVMLSKCRCHQSVY